jgi:ABC-type Fe3+ transport system permease subunit
MQKFRVMGRAAGAVLWALALAPLLALGPAAVFDRGAGGTVRPTLFPIALAALDPFVWDCIRNSLVLAATVTLASGVAGVATARMVQWRFLGRRPLAALACVGLAVPPAFGAIGLRSAAGSAGWAPILTGDASATSAPGTFLAMIGPWFGFAAWFWVALAFGAPVVALATASALDRVSPSCEDAARLAGAGRRRAWWQLVWPAVRPDVARALGLVFSLTLLEPGAPMVLG